jgi:glycosyltransferase involved in cell wall biosynthesis
VLLSTYNGEKHLSTQLQSILEQQDVDLDLFIHDDGSSDQTINIIRKYENEHSCIHLISIEHLGVPGSYFSLIESVPDNYDYYSFADQDDIWHKYKLKTAANMLTQIESSSLKIYCGALTILDDKTGIKIVRSHKRSSLSLSSACIQNTVTGNTLVLDKQSMLQIKSLPQPRLAIMHDWWIFIVLSALDARMVYDPTPYISYRQHQSNAIGMANSQTNFANLIKDIFCPTKYFRIKKQSEEIALLLEDTAKPDSIDLLINFSASHHSMVDRIKYLLNTPVKARTMARNIWHFICRLRYG